MTQRPGKSHKAALGADGVITVSRVIEFANEANRLLADANETDAAFYFEQLADFLKRHPEKGLSESVSRILGL